MKHKKIVRYLQFRLAPELRDQVGEQVNGFIKEYLYTHTYDLAYGQLKCRLWSILDEELERYEA